MSTNSPLESTEFSTAPPRMFKILIGLAVVAAALLAFWLFRSFPPSHGASTQVGQGINPHRPKNTTIGGFDLGDSLVEPGRVFSGGVLRDQIPALSRPTYVSAANATYLQPNDRVIGLQMGETAKAYPIHIMNFHEIVNDVVSDVPIAITYCPLCDSVFAFDRRTPIGTREFGVSGLLYNSNVMLYDRTPSVPSLWPQLMGKGINAAGKNEPLSALPCHLMTWQEWTTLHPTTEVLSLQTGHNRNYSQDVYAPYHASKDLNFPVEMTDQRLPLKMRVLGLWSGDSYRAFPASSFSSARSTVTEKLNDKEFTISFVPKTGSMQVQKHDEGINWVYSYWFSWYAFHPTTTVFK